MSISKKPFMLETTYNRIALAGLLGSLAIASGFANVAAYKAGYDARIESLTSTGTTLLKITHTPNTLECTEAVNKTALKLARFIIHSPEFQNISAPNFKQNVKTAADNARTELKLVCTQEIFDASVQHAANTLGGDNSISHIINQEHLTKTKISEQTENITDFNTSSNI